MRRNVIWVLMLISLIACGGGAETDVRTQNGPTDFSGSSARFSLSDVWMPGVGEELGPAVQPFNQFQLDILDYPASCSTPDAGTLTGRHAGVFLSITAFKTEALAPRTYVLGVAPDGGLPWALANYSVFESSCYGPIVPGASGTIALSRVDDTSAEGTLDVTLSDATRVRGHFVATRCPPPPGFSPLPDGGFDLPPPQPWCQ